MIVSLILITRTPCRISPRSGNQIRDIIVWSHFRPWDIQNILIILRIFNCHTCKNSTQKTILHLPLTFLLIFVVHFSTACLNFTKILPKWENIQIKSCFGNLSSAIRILFIHSHIWDLLHYWGNFSKHFSTPFSISLKVDFLWVLYFFIYLSILFFLRWTWNYNLPL